MERTEPEYMMFDKKGPAVVKNFIRRGFAAVYCPTPAAALQQAIDWIPAQDTVAWGGSAAVAEIGLLDYVREHREVIDRDKARDRAEKLELRRRSLLADTFLMGTNAATEDGQLFNIDGTGNRLAALCYGPRQVIVVAGMNKVAPTLEAAIARARSVAAPMNMQRFARKTPCSRTGMCADCLSEDSICNEFLRTRRCDPPGRIKVILVGEDIGY
jgi:hypothetical protein